MSEHTKDQAMPAEPRYLKEVFLAALAVGPDERASWLDEACGQDADLRRHVELMLAAHDTPQSLLDRPARAAIRPELPSFGAAATIDEPIAERPGIVIGPYKLLEQIGEGGFGVVFMAEQTQPVRRKVALKVLKPGMDTRQVVARFEAERQALALMDHPNIAHVFDGGATASGRPYFVMELVRGVPITSFCDQSHLSVRERLELFMDVCQAVQHAHLKGIIHRDLKPTNVLVTLHDDRSVVKVIDFGVAKATGQQLTEKTLFTNFAQMIGTPLYMSPEQAQMSGLDVDTRTDIYALGVLLYELLTGTTPFDRERLRTAGYDEVRRIIRDEEPARPSTRISTLGPAANTASANRKSDPKKLRQLLRGELDWIVMRALEKDRNRRYETASAFAADVQRYLADEPVQACPPSAGYRFRKFARRNRTVLATGLALAVAVLATVGSLIGAVTVLADSKTRIEGEQKETQDALDREKQVNDQLVKSIEREVRAKYRQNVQLADRELAANNVGRAEELLDDCPAALRGWEWNYLKGRHYRDLVTFRGHIDWVSGVAFSPDGRRAVSGSAITVILGDLKVWDTATGKTIRTLFPAHFGPVSGVAYSNDGKTIASASWDKTVRLWDTSTWKSRRILEGHTAYVSCVAISPDSRVVASGSGDHTVKLWDAASGQEVRRLLGHTSGLFSVAFSPDGRALASASQDGTIRIWDVATGKEVHTLRGHTGAVLRVAYSRDGRRLASAGFEGNVTIWDPATGRHLLTIRTNVLFAMGVAFNRDGTRLAIGGWDKTVKLCDAETGEEVLSLRDHTDLVTDLAFSQDGRLLASASLDKTVKVWDATPGRGGGGGEALSLGGQGEALISLFYSPDGRYLASAGFEGTVKFRDPLTGKELMSLPSEDGPVWSLSFSRDGRRLAFASFRGVVNVWDVAAGKELATFRGNLGGAALSPDGRRVAWTREGGIVEIRGTESGRELLEFHAHPAPVPWVSYSPDGKRLVTTSWDKKAKVWDATNGARICTLSGHTHVVGFAAFSPDGARVATASWDGTAKVWDASTGKELLTLRGHTGRVGGVAFSPDGKYLATASDDNTARVWDGMTGKALRTLRGHVGYVPSVAFSPDGKRLATASGYHGRWEIKIWDAALWEEKRDGK
jgi:WD40 repeat protein/serine/threonine protein kinase